MQEAELKEAVRVAYEYSYRHDDWVTPLNEALAGVDAERALFRANEHEKGIWDIVLHLAVWNENIVERISTGQASRPTEGSWPTPPAAPDPEEWERAKTRLRDSLDSVEEIIRSTSLAQIEASPYGLPDLLCRMIHNAYHLGQITKLR